MENDVKTELSDDYERIVIATFTEEGLKSLSNEGDGENICDDIKRHLSARMQRGTVFLNFFNGEVAIHLKRREYKLMVSREESET